MYILVAGPAEKPCVSLEEPEDCARFHVAIRGLPREAADRALERAGVGSLADADVAWISVAALRERADGQVTDGWSERFDGMLAYAGRKGWLSEDQRSVQGHCKWS